MVAPLTLLPLTFHWYAGEVPPLVGVAVKVTDVPAQTGLALALIATLTGLSGSTKGLNVPVAGLPVAQVSLDVTMHVITSPVAGAYVYVLLVPTIPPPLMCHSNAGVVPPFTGTAVYITDVPVQTGLALALIATLTGLGGLTEGLNVPVAGLPVAQVSLEVTIHVITSPIAGAYV